MTGHKNQASLARDIAAALNRHHTCADYSRLSALLTPTPKKLLLAGMALAALQTDAALALSLGDIKVKSALGQPLIATASAHIGAGESLNEKCITATALPIGASGSGNQLQIQVRGTATAGVYPVEIRSATPLYEPMYEIRLQVKCSGSMALAKNYVVMLGLPMTSSQPTLAATLSGKQQNQAGRTPTPEPIEKARTQPVVNRRQQYNADTSDVNTASVAAQKLLSNPVAAGTSYRVQPGDTLSKIAERVEGRPVGTTYQVANLLFERNPKAFVNGNANALRAGVLIQIPARAELAGISSETRPQPAQPAAVTQNSPVEAQSVASVTVTSELSVIAETTTSPAAAAPVTLAFAEVANAPEAAPRIQVNTAPATTAAVTEAPLPIMESLNKEIQPMGSVAFAVSPKAKSTPPAEVAPLAAPAAVPASQPGAATAQPNTFVAVGFGVLLGLLLAGLMRGYRRILSLLPAKKHPPKHDSKDIFADIPQTVEQPAAPVVAALASAEKFVMPAPPIHVVESALIQVSPAAKVAVKPAATVDSDSARPTVNQSPRISLRGSDDSDETIESALDFDMGDTEESAILPESHGSAAHAAGKPLNSNFDPARTMSDLFGDTSATTDNTDEAVTAELPQVAEADLDATSDLRTLSARTIGNDDNDLSSTLSMALGLLEQDYEDELTASQILSKQDVHEALLQQGGKKH